LLLALGVGATTLVAGSIAARAEEAPNLTLDTPVDNLYVRLAQVKVSGQTNGDSLAAVSEGVETTTPIGDGGRFTLNVGLHEGLNTIVVMSSRGGIETTMTRRVTLDTVTPTMTPSIASRTVFPSVGRRARTNRLCPRPKTRTSSGGRVLSCPKIRSSCMGPHKTSRRG